MKVSPFDGNILAVAASQNFGLKGSGRLYIVSLPPRTDPPVEGQVLQYFDFRDGIFDVAWAKLIETRWLLVEGWKSLSCHFGDVKAPVVSLYGHNKEISSLDWCPFDKTNSSAHPGTARFGYPVVIMSMWFAVTLGLLMKPVGAPDTPICSCPFQPIAPPDYGTIDTAVQLFQPW